MINERVNLRWVRIITCNQRTPYRLFYYANSFSDIAGFIRGTDASKCGRSRVFAVQRPK